METCNDIARLFLACLTDRGKKDVPRPFGPIDSGLIFCSFFVSFMNSRLLLSLILAIGCPTGSALAQSDAQIGVPSSPAASGSRERPQPAQRTSDIAPADAAAPHTHDQKIEHLHHSDSGSTIDEVREGGEARSISVQPHYGHTPAYDIVPERTTPNPLSGQRVWNVLKF